MARQGFGKRPPVHQVGDDGEHVDRVPGEPIEFRHNQRVAGAAEIHQQSEFGATLAGRTRDFFLPDDRFNIVLQRRAYMYAVRLGAMMARRGGQCHLPLSP